MIIYFFAISCSIISVLHFGYKTKSNKILDLRTVPWSQKFKIYRTKWKNTEGFKKEGFKSEGDLFLMLFERTQLLWV